MDNQAATGPACPKCNARPITMDQFIGKFPNGLLVCLIHCHDCGHVLPAFMCGADQPQIVAPSGPRLVV